MKKQLFLSDFHLGVPDVNSSLDREKRICLLLDQYASEVSDIYFVGDIFDFWFEYTTVVPKGYYRFLGKLAELSDNGIQLHFFKGNHDMWMRDLFTKEFKAIIYSQPIEIRIGLKSILIGHGDGLGPGDFKYKFLKTFFASSICQFLFRWIHPDLGIGIANFFSYRSRYGQPLEPEKYHGNKNEWLYVYCQKIMKDKFFDYYIFGHRHLPIYTKLDNTTSIYLNLGDWLDYNTYAIFDGNEVSLRQYGSEKSNFDFNPNPIS
ncbi:MAG: UDP-2,3-diacylglucosamine diphosphatase [Chitinophagales bacterium]|nr:UDP-2,3-diacylglucosamine diphosphatase [Sphingobacteriales bacterium]